MAGSGYVDRLRRLVGHQTLLLPSVTLLPRDPAGRLLLVREADSGAWGTIGGAVELGESPREAAVREAREEAGVEVAVGAILAAVGGREYEVEYASGDRCAYVAVVFEAEVVSGSATADGEETTAAGWFDVSELAELELNPFARALFAELALLPVDRQG